MTAYRFFSVKKCSTPVQYTSSFSYAAPAAWNSLPLSLQELSDTASFKQNLKTLLFQRAFYL